MTLGFGSLKNRLQIIYGRVPSDDSLGIRFARGAFWALVGTLISQTLRMFAAIVTVRLLGRDTYGQLGILYSTVETFGILAGIGLGLTATKHVAELRAGDPGRVGRILGLSFIVALIMGGIVCSVTFVYAPEIAKQILNAPGIVSELRLASLLLFLNAIIGVQNGALSGFEAFKTLSQLGLVRGVLNFPILIICVWYLGLIGAILADVIVGCASFALYLAALVRECRKANVLIMPRGSGSEFPVLWKFALPAMLNSILLSPMVWVCNTILVNQPDGYGEMGLLSVGNQWRTLLMFLPAIFIQVTLPILASSLGDSSDDKYKKVLVLTQNLTLTAVLPAGSLLIFGADLLMKLYGSGFAEGNIVLIGIIATVMIQSAGGALGAVVAAKGMMWFGLIQNLSWGAVLIGLVWYFAPFFGAKALAFGSALSYIIMTIWTFLYLSSWLPVGLLKRVVYVLCYVVLLTGLCLLLPIVYRIVLMIPATVLTAYITLFVLTTPDFRFQVFGVTARIFGKGRQSQYEVDV